jgi:hypothetical protein
MNPIPIPWKCIERLTLFLSLWIILSVWIGYLGFLSPLLGVFSLIVTYALTRHSPTEFPKGNGFLFMAVSVIILLGMGSVYLGLLGGYDLSADAAPSVATLVMGNTIPSTYEPYFELPFLYQVGLPSIASQFHWTGLRPDVFLWIFSLIGIFLSIAGLIWVGSLLKGNDAGVVFWIPILFLASRLPFYNVLLGEYPWVLAAGLGIMSIGMMHRSWILGTIVLAAAFLTHPYIGILSALAWILLLRPPVFSMIRTAGGSFMIALPILMFQVLPLVGVEREPISAGGIPSLSAIIGNIMLVGLIPILVAAGWIVYKLYMRHSFSRTDYVLVLVGFGSLFVGVFLNALAPELILGTKFPALALIGIILLGARGLSAIVPSSKKGIAAILILVLAGGVLFTSASMQSFATGSKSSIEEAQFARVLYQMDPEVVLVLFLSPGVGKMAHYAEKIPSDPKGAHFMLALQFLATPYALELKKQSDAHRALFASQCAECVDGFIQKYPQKYIVVNTAYFPPLEDKTILRQEGNFILYAGNE